jgi:hypothetical protein
VTHWFSVQPDVQLYRIGHDTSALLGVRVKLKL